jgi:hypothetical protein
MSSELTYGREFLSNRSMNPFTIINSIYIGKVKSIVSDKNDGIIQVHIDMLDEKLNIDELPLCYPLMSRVFYAMPKVDEAVLVLMGSTKESIKNNTRGNRFWIGPIITNYNDIINDELGSSRNLNYDPLSVKSRNNKEDERGRFPIDGEDTNEISIIGRDNTDISQSENKIRLRAGKHKNKNPTQINEDNPVYNILELIDNNTSYSLTAGDEIYLISHKGKETFKKILTKDDIADLKNNTQSMLYGELTVEYLKILTEAFLTHIHQHPQKQPIKKQVVVALESKLNQIQELLAKNIKIN